MKQKVFEPYVEKEYLCGVFKRHCMKQLIKKLSIAWVLCIFITNAYSNVNHDTQVNLRRPYPIGGSTRPSHSPTKPSAPIEVYFDSNSESMIFVGNKNNKDEVSYIIYDENGFVVATGSCVFDEEGKFSIALSPLRKGMYSIGVIANGEEFIGAFEVY